MESLSTIGTIIGGIFSVFVAVAFVTFLYSLLGRATGTTFRTRGGNTIKPFRTPSEIQKAIETEEFQKNFFSEIKELESLLYKYYAYPEYTKEIAFNIATKGNIKEILDPEKKIKISERCEHH